MNVARFDSITDSDHQVRHEAEVSIGRLLRHESCLDLLNALESSTGCRSWSYLEAAISVGDPVLLSSRSDILWLGAKISKMSPGIHRYARKLIKRQSEKLEKGEETEDRKRDRD